MPLDELFKDKNICVMGTVEEYKGKPQIIVDDPYFIKIIMRRAKHPLPFEMQSIKFDLPSGKFNITEDGVTYYLTIEHTRLLKAYF